VVPKFKKKQYHYQTDENLLVWLDLIFLYSLYCIVCMSCKGFSYNKI